MAAAMEAKEFAERFPGRVNQVMDALAEGQLTLNIQGIDEQDIMRGVQKLANRVAGAVVVASLVIGAALIMRIQTDAQLFGYPALAIVLFLIAAASAMLMLGGILMSDLPQRKRSDRRELTVARAPLAPGIHGADDDTALADAAPAVQWRWHAGPVGPVSCYPVNRARFPGKRGSAVARRLRHPHPATMKMMKMTSSPTRKPTLTRLFGRDQIARDTGLPDRADV